MVVGDSQSGINALTKFRSSVPFINSALRKVVELAGAFDFDVTARWVPRDNLNEADALSREPDPGDWALSPDVFQKATEFFSIKPAVDLFASGNLHVAETFISKYYTPGCAGVNARSVDISKILNHGDTAWVFPPPGLTGLALDLIDRFKAEALVCISVPEGSLVKMQLQRIAPQSLAKVFPVPKAETSCTPSLRVPERSRNPAFLGLQVYHIKWP